MAADDELSRKLNRRLQLNEELENNDSHYNFFTTGKGFTPEAPVARKTSSCSSHESDRSSVGISESASDELTRKLARRQDINEGADGDHVPVLRAFNPYSEFKEFSRKQIKDYEKFFKLHDVNKDGFIDMEELKRMMEKLGAPQTHLALKQMIKEVDEDQDGKLNFREFMLIFRKAAAGELKDDSGLSVLANLTEIDVDQTGVVGAKSFFEAKIEKIAKGSQFEQEIRAEQERARLEAEERKTRRKEFKEKAAVFAAS